ncbi:MAG: DNA internalization-related competence protein ComEC/Rec2 [Gammaproteobacteria bacterium]|uniref:DNA internalization-related competence protein ComEC/Rec2 n=1 Tax=Rhodoferax sp. TaxID=50421 RepID=UPI0018031300|nr:DNA internalization-related competence protein ComEC/Rec2 [Rhodoferax sp.]MBU3899673.1 DNA internalization-related competence protein ComEC/Rec2 [Gammaproteobacteria bacterium]MBA3056362.1 DNA internalization-related competence protein ComEC/Rec2 [Rhodoferax sp.]MBU3996239.1 DNA internalization-related competence protein ComEC/Rec2 [Gammaproteobacteria bacterium]MBU4018149.1 DNA internalization-related competence protein ComEC/Rec2 [Gammaproteobacteria bacterium]MBU4080160.1 DNA internaliza
MDAAPTHSSARARLVFPALLGFVAGTALQLQQPGLWLWPVYASFVLLALVFFAPVATRKIAFVYRSALMALALGVLAFGLTGLRASIYANQALDASLEGRDVAVSGLVAAMPQRSETGLRFRLDVESAQLQGQPVRVPPRLYLAWYADRFAGGDAQQADERQRQPAPLQAGERWRFTVRLKAPHGASNPFGYDFELWLWEQGLQATGYVRAGPKDPTPQQLTQTHRRPVELARQLVREQIFGQVEDRQYAGLIAALVVGDQNAIDRADWDVFRATGVAHLMSISGLHVTMFAWLAALLVGWLWRRSTGLCLWLPAPSAALVGGVLLAGAYALFSGWGVPSQRTVLMLATVGLLRLSGRRWPWPHVWLLVCAVVVAVDPWALLQAGFWLSFVAVGVLFASDSAASNSINTGARGRFIKIFREQGVITLALTPLTLLLFGQVSVVGLVANALAIPWVTLVVTPLAMAGVALAPLWDGAAWAIAALSWYLQLLAALPFATITVAQAPFWAGVAGVTGGAVLVMQWPWSVRLLGLPLMLPVLLWQAPRPSQGQFELLAADVGQGNAVLVRTAHHALLYDAGPRYSRESDAGHRVLVPLLRALDTPLDTLLLSHRDSDHTGGALALLAMQPQATLLSSVEDAHELQAVRPVTRCVSGQRWHWDGVDFEVLHPQAADYDAVRKSNAMSCVLRLSNGVQSALLAGDIEQAQEAQLVLEGAKLKADVLLVPHHGSKTSSSAAFLDAVQPRLALVQAGYRNRFGHPAEAVLLRYQERNIRVIASPRCGAATWQSMRPEQIQCQRSVTLRYWQHRVP